ncbi:hypothetical protein [Yinghuangia seranimata]|uniref:hypothetical protein n=1 Tax=Yinghuangia seranimata TaxID=408067 RepID=UPI00248D1DD6|nr:hypothetical protein [Yinghuangia seranimata]MDI2130400.1 hypothetical protein [Yinghuangia seranimata]
MRIRLSHRAVAALALALPIAVTPALTSTAVAAAAKPFVTVDGLADVITYNAAPDEFTVTVSNPGTGPVSGRVLVSVEVDTPGDMGAFFEYYDTAKGAWTSADMMSNLIPEASRVGGWLGADTTLAPGETRQIKARFGYKLAKPGYADITKGALSAWLVAPEYEATPWHQQIATGLAWYTPKSVTMKVEDSSVFLTAGGQHVSFRVHLTSDPAMDIGFRYLNSVLSAGKTPLNTCQAALQIRNPKTDEWKTVDATTNFQVLWEDYQSGTPQDRVFEYRAAIGMDFPVGTDLTLNFGIETTGPDTLVKGVKTFKTFPKADRDAAKQCASFDHPPAEGAPLPAPAPPSPKPDTNAPHLAETGGSDSDMTLYGAIGGAVLVAGAGSVLFARRRNGA